MTSMTTSGSVYNGRTAALDLAHAAEDYRRSDYKCLTLDCIAAGFDIVVSFLPKNNQTIVAFVGCIIAFKFSRTLRNKCKTIEAVKNNS